MHDFSLSYHMDDIFIFHFRISWIEFDTMDMITVVIIGLGNMLVIKIHSMCLTYEVS
jgi:hypothetical protein